MFKSIAVVAVLLGAVAYAQPLNQDNTIDANQVINSGSILRTLIKFEASAEGAKYMLPFTGKVDKIRYPDLEKAWIFFYEHFNSNEAREALTPYPRVLSLCKAILQVGQPTANSVEDQDQHYNSVYDLYRQYRVQHVPIFYNQAMFTMTKVGHLLESLFGLNDFPIEDRTISVASDEFTEQNGMGFSVGQSLNEVFKYMEQRSTYLGTVPATFLRFNMPNITNTYFEAGQDVNNFKKVFFQKIKDAHLIVLHGQMKYIR